MSKKYEAIFIIKNDEDNKKIEEVIEKINNMVISEYCNIFHEEKIGTKRFGVRIDIWTHFMRGCIIDYVH